MIAGKVGWADVWKKGFFAWEYKGPKMFTVQGEGTVVDEEE